MSRAMWKGHISFGLVQIPVELHTAVRDQDLSFDLLDKRDHAPVGYKRYNKRTGEELTAEHIVKGYEHEKGEYVIVTDDDFREANVEATQTVDLVAFVDAAAIDPTYMVKPYYVLPGRKAEKAYALLREVMTRTGRVGVARVVIRSRQYIASLYVQGKVLVLELLRYAAEVLDTKPFDLPGEDLGKLGVSERELAMAEKLVAGLQEDWDPEAYKDEYRADLMALIERKAAEGETAPRLQVAERAEGGKAQVIDIMALLKRSVEATDGRRAAPAEEVEKKPKKRARGH